MSAISRTAASNSVPVSGISRRSAGLAGIGAMTAASAIRPLFAKSDSPAPRRVAVGVMGLSRGLSLAHTFAGLPNVTVKYLCETDSRRLASAIRAFEQKHGSTPQGVGDFRRILDDPEIDALICAAPNHWHAPAGILACAAGKHCYVEKPCSHNPWEGEMLVAAARRHGRCVQMGSQRRSCQAIMEGIRMAQAGQIGRVYYARCWYANLRGPVPPGRPAAVPSHLDYDLWQGPAPRQPFVSNRLHYHWHWFWHYGNGELGNNGVHTLDLARWGLNADYPIRVTSSGGRWRFDDEQQTPDTHVVSFEFEGRRQCVWEGLSCNRRGIDGDSFGVTLHGEDGTIKLSEWGWQMFDHRGRPAGRSDGRRSDADHAQNFIDAIRADDPALLNAEIEEGHRSTLLCHLGNIAQRTGHSLQCDPADGRILNSDEAAALWKRDYEPGWEPVV